MQGSGKIPSSLPRTALAIDLQQHLPQSAIAGVPVGLCCAIIQGLLLDDFRLSGLCHYG